MALLVAGLPGMPGALSARGQELRAKRAVIVSFPDKVDVGRVLRQNGIAAEYRYERVINGFAAMLPATTVAVLTAIPGAIVSPDLPVSTTGQEGGADSSLVGSSGTRRRATQVLPTGVNRIDADKNVTADIARNGTTTAIAGVGIAILDTGIAKHEDLNLQVGKRCIGNTGTSDRDGHGTHVAGTAAAKDNRIGVVGVAPGAPVYPVKVLGDDGGGSFGSIICGLDWVVANRATIDVVNMSLGGQDPRITTCNNDAFHQAVCRVVAAGIPVVVAAGNEAVPADTTAPARFDEAITVSAFADSDGQAGRNGARTCFNNGDDTFARAYSNYDPNVDIAAPGDCIRSTFPGDRYRVLTGTSMATPHVTGAVALHLSEVPTASPAEVTTWLLSEGSVPQTDANGFLGDTDGQLEPALYLGPTQPA